MTWRKTIFLSFSFWMNTTKATLAFRVRVSHPIVRMTNIWTEWKWMLRLFCNVLSMILKYHEISQSIRVFGTQQISLCYGVHFVWLVSCPPSAKYINSFFLSHNSSFSYPHFIIWYKMIRLLQHFARYDTTHIKQSTCALCSARDNIELKTEEC